MRGRLSRIIAIFIIALIFIIGLQLSLTIVKAVQEYDRLASLPPMPYHSSQADPLANFPVISDTVSQSWASISGNCIAYRDASGGVFLHNLTLSQTIAITTVPDNPLKVAISDGIVVWRNDRDPTEGRGIWGYYHPECSDERIFGTAVISPFYIVARTNAHAPAISGEMLTFDTWAPAGAWYIAQVELDANDNDIPDATEVGYDPFNDSILIRLSCCRDGQYVTFWQRLSDVYWDDDYKIACWSNVGWQNSDGVMIINELICNDLNHYQEFPAWGYQFIVNDDTWIAPPDYKGIISVYRDLVVWTGAREANLSGYDLYIADLDVDDDGTLNHEDDDYNNEPFEFVLVNRPANQEHPDIWWPFVIWTDYRDGGTPEIYAYDLSLDSDGDSIENWRDHNRVCIDPAEFRVTVDPALQWMPEVYSGTAVWEDRRSGGDGDVYSATLQPVQPHPRQTISGTAVEKAEYWLNKQMVRYATVNEIPNYVTATGLITRYKSFTHAGEVHIRRAEYEAITGTYTVSFDFCYFGTPDQKRYLGRFGHGFTYDQALVLIARTMLSQPDQAVELGRHVSGLQNSGQLTFTTAGSFGFSFNGRGYWGELDNFNDMDYLRGGANGWLGYGYLFYTDHYSDVQFMAVMTGVAEYILSLQVLDPITDARYGLFKGGYGRWSHENPDEFIDGEVDWVSAEHNIDIYFFLRDLGRLTGDSRYIEAANLQREYMIELWNEKKGRFDQGIGDDFDALDAASWGAMYWIAVGDLDKARRSLAYADKTYSNTVTVSNTVTISPEITLWGYKPYFGDDGVIDWTDLDLVWSEGSLGVAMANLKLGYTLLNQCNDLQGDTYIQKAEAIMAEMEKLQSLDSDGGLFYSVYPDYDSFPGGVITDFARAPSAAGTTWFLMVKKAMEDEAWRDAFWGPDPNRTVTCLNKAPNVPNNPIPANSATNVLTDTILTWQGGDPDDDVVTYTIAFGESSPLPVAATTTMTSYEPELSSGTTYHWIVTATDGEYIRNSPTWTFTTKLSIFTGTYWIYLPLVSKSPIND